jgi:ATP-binding cassette subfamily B multidrug efflux pump
LLRLIRFLKPYSFQVACVLTLVLLQSLFELYLPNLMSKIVDKGIVNGDIDYITRTGGVMLLVAGCCAFCAVSSGYFAARTSSGFGKILRSKIFSHVENFSLQEFDRIGTPSLITRTTNDVTQVQMLTLMMLRIFVSAPVMCAGGVIMAVSMDPTLSLVLVVAVPVLAVIIAIITGKSLPLFKAMQGKIDRINLILRENLSGVRVIRAFNRTDYERKRFNEANLDLTATAVRVHRMMATLMPVLMLVMNLTAVAIIWFGGIRIDAGYMQVGALMAFLQYAMQIMFSLLMASMLFVMIPRAAASADRINEILDTTPSIRDGVQARDGGRGGLVEFKNVTFSYPGAEKPALRNVSFKAKSGEVTAIIGGTGAGKTTLINLIPRFYDVCSGSIMINGVDIREMTQRDLRAKIGLVPQKAVLFTGTIADNIRYGKRDATDEEVRRAADIAQATGFISGLKEGFNSSITRGGTNISGGQKQRLSIARALAGKPEIYIFDDSFSALDYKTEAGLRRALKKETAGACVLIVSQRVCTIMGADRIIVLDEGEVAGIGRHKELIESCRVYREIVSSQLSGGEIA